MRYIVMGERNQDIEVIVDADSVEDAIEAANDATHYEIDVMDSDTTWYAATATE